jgi:hypothetical protein
MEKNMILINDAIKQSSTTKKPAKSTKKSFEVIPPKLILRSPDALF